MSRNKYTVMVAAMQPPEEKARQCLIPKIVILTVVTDIIISLQNYKMNHIISMVYSQDSRERY